MSLGQSVSCHIGSLATQQPINACLDLDSTQNGLSNTIAAPGKLADASRQMVDAVPVSAGASLGLSATAPAGTLEGAREVAEAEAAEADKAMETSKGQKEATKQRPAERDREKKAKARYVSPCKDFPITYLASSLLSVCAMCSALGLACLLSALLETWLRPCLVSAKIPFL